MEVNSFIIFVPLFSINSLIFIKTDMGDIESKLRHAGQEIEQTATQAGHFIGRLFSCPEGRIYCFKNGYPQDESMLKKMGTSAVCNPHKTICAQGPQCSIQKCPNALQQALAACPQGGYYEPFSLFEGNAFNSKGWKNTTISLNETLIPPGDCNT